MRWAIWITSVASSLTHLRGWRHPQRMRAPSIVRHAYEAGIQALPIVAMIAFFVAVIIAYIGASQLRDFGAGIYTVDLITVGVLRELGVLLTAIIVAGRSGSAFAAEIGVMQLNDEVDALKSIGLDPIEVLVVPRVLGLIIALPLLTDRRRCHGHGRRCVVVQLAAGYFHSAIPCARAGCAGADHVLGGH